MSGLEIIKSSAEISELFARGKRVHTPYLTFIVLPNKHDRADHPGGRVAFVAGKKLGNAVWRNAAKRRMRALCRDIGGPWDGRDVVFLAKAKVTSASYEKLIESARFSVGKIISPEIED